MSDIEKMYENVELQNAKLPQTIQNLDLVLVSEWNNYFEYPRLNSFRQMIFHNKYGINKCIRHIGGRIYVKVTEFFKWLEEQSKAKLEEVE